MVRLATRERNGRRVLDNRGKVNEKWRWVGDRDAGGA
jgi:hypothetical protein